MSSHAISRVLANFFVREGLCVLGKKGNEHIVLTCTAVNELEVNVTLIMIVGPWYIGRVCPGSSDGGIAIFVAVMAPE